MTGVSPATLTYVVLAFAGAALGTFIIRHMARRFGLFARPRADRWHQQPVALHGGVGFYPPFLVTACLLLWGAAGIGSAAESDWIHFLPAYQRLSVALLADPCSCLWSDYGTIYAIFGL